ncbi:MAG: DUF3667 domain-containing protein [Myxococcaceae bacterium]
MPLDPNQSPQIPACSNCDHPTTSAYCPECGQAQPSPQDYSIVELVKGGVEELTAFDGRIWGTLRALLFQPGLLAWDHFHGRRARYLSPFRIFVIANVAAWFVMPYLRIVGFSLARSQKVVLFPELWSWALPASAALRGVSVEAVSARIEALGSAEDAAAVLCMIPLFALAVAAVMPGRGHRFVQHLVFSAHFYCIHLFGVLLVIGGVVMSVFGQLEAHPEWPLSAPVLGVLRSFWVQHLLVAPFLLPYLFLALKRAYALTPGQSAWRAAALTAWACFIAPSFFDVAFALVLVFA